MFDILVVLVLVVSAIFGFVRGATRELVSVLAFLAAVAAAIAALHYTSPFIMALVETEWVAKSIALLLVFLAVYIALRLLGGALARRVHETELGSLDRIVGLGFGLVRAVVVLGVFNLVFHAAVPVESTPPWVVGARLYPLTETAAEALRTLAPKGILVAGKVAPALKRAVTISVDTPPGEKGDKAGK